MKKWAKKKPKTTKKPETMKQRSVTADEWLRSRCGNLLCTSPRSPVIIAPDPYSMEIHGDFTDVALCKVCRRDRAMEV